MTETVVIAETVKGTVHPSTAELITAAQSLGSQPVVVVPCTDASAAEIAAGFVGSARVVAAKSSVFEHYDAAGWASAIDAVAPAGILIASATPQSKDLAARIAARREISVVQDVTQIEGGNLTSFRAARRVRHHTFWVEPPINGGLAPARYAPPPTLTTRLYTPEEEAVISELAQRVDEAAKFMSNFSDDIRGFFLLEEHSRSGANPVVVDASACLSKVEELFRQSATFLPYFRRRGDATKLFANALDNVFSEVNRSYDAYPDELKDAIDDWAEKVVSVLRVAVGHVSNGSFHLASYGQVHLFFWRFVATLYETGEVVKLLKTHSEPGDRIRRENAMAGLAELNSWLPDTPAHERPEGDDARRGRRQRTTPPNNSP